MDKTVLIEYADMKEEIKDLRRRIADDEKKIAKLESSIVTDSVTCGKKGKKPLRTVKIKGFPKMEIDRQRSLLKRRIIKLAMLELDYLEKQIQVEEYIEQIKKSELRTMFRLYYFDGMTWSKVAMQMNLMFPKRRISYTEDNCWRRNKRFFENVG